LPILVDDIWGYSLKTSSFKIDAITLYR
jgi:hypothetical protein